MKLSLLPLFLFATISDAVPATFAPQDQILGIKESVSAPNDWTRLGRAPSDSTIRLRIAIVQRDFLGLEKSLYEISDPDHHRYGAHLSKEEVDKFVAPHPASLALVDGWLTSHGINESDLVRSPAKDWVTVTVPLHLAEEILGADYYIWQHISGDVLVRTTAYKLPRYLHQHIELIQPTTMFTRSKGMAPILYPEEDEPLGSVKPVVPFNNPHVDPTCATKVTLGCIMQLYNAVGYKPEATKKNAIGITGFLDQYANQQDLVSFYHDQLPVAVNSTFKSVAIHGGINNQTLSVAGEEANLDTQFAFGISYPTPGTFWSTGGRPPFHPDGHTPTGNSFPSSNKSAWLDYILRSDHIPQTISTSYGDDEQTVPFSYASRVCKRFAELGCMGVSVLFASGDGGVGDGNPDLVTQECHTSDRKHTRRFIPAFPAVTAVGGTMSIPEVAANFSGGGFSDYFHRPAYQDTAVGAYLHKLHPRTYEGLFNRAGRVRFLFLTLLPDSAYIRPAHHDRGTSAATPTFAGLVALLNDARLAARRPALGFLNPLLYKRGAHALNDVVAGGNPGCGTPGFNATEGWDPVTGLGTPDFRKLMEVCI
ncbi:tripeptidyl peptidase A [Mycena capillaripes]|nr:tripeptidyl peptidase A [Mycena capillaripes]